MKWFLIFVLLFSAGCATTANRFPPGSNVQVTEWQILHGSDGAKTLRGTVVNQSPYLVYDVDLVTLIYEEGILREKRVTRLPNLFAGTNSNFEVMLPGGLTDPQPKFEYQFHYMREEEFDEYQYDKRYGVGPFQMYPSARASWYRSAAEEAFDSRRGQ